MSIKYGFRISSSGSSYTVNSVYIVITNCEYLYVDSVRYENFSGDIQIASSYNATSRKYTYTLLKGKGVTDEYIINHTNVSSSESHNYQIYGKNMTFLCGSVAGTVSSISGYTKPNFDKAYSVNEGDSLYTGQTVGFVNNLEFKIAVTPSITLGENNFIPYFGSLEINKIFKNNVLLYEKALPKKTVTANITKSGDTYYARVDFFDGRYDDSSKTKIASYSGNNLPSTLSLDVVSGYLTISSQIGGDPGNSISTEQGTSSSIVEIHNESGSDFVGCWQVNDNGTLVVSMYFDW